MPMRVRAAKPSDAGPIARVHVDSWRETYAGIVPDEYLVGLSYRDRWSTWTDILSAGRPAECNFVAERDERGIVGFAGGGPGRDGNLDCRGELYAIYVLVDRVRKVLTALILAERIDSFIADAPPGWRVHRLSGDRQNDWSVSISGNWRITFVEERGYVDRLNLEDYH